MTRESCISGKKIYSTEALAVDALLDNWAKYDHAENRGPTGVYHCEECGGYHLTSKGRMNDRLKEFLSGKDYRIRSQASAWIQKLRDK